MLSKTLERKASSGDKSLAHKMQALKREADREKNTWKAFHLLREGLGHTTYRETIRAELGRAETLVPPPAYTMLWQLNPRGMMSLNLDRLASRAFTTLHPGRNFNEFNGNRAGANASILKSPSPYMVNLHGVLAEEDTWVFTSNDLDKTINDPAYLNFITSVIATSTILFVGVTVDDTAVGGHFERLRNVGFQTGRHFWITHRRNFGTDSFAESRSIQVIRYTADKDDHSELAQCLQNLLEFKPTDDLPPPISPTLMSLPKQDTIPSPEYLVNCNAEIIRGHLNTEAAKLLSADHDSSYKNYESFVAKYDQAIYRAWYVSENSPDNRVLGITLEEEIASGAFGRVFRGYDASGNEVAVKILREEIRRNRENLQSFRRGVRSMRILSERNVLGMVAYKEAYEIPALAVMDFIDGTNLHESVVSKRLVGWDNIIDVSRQLTEIIQRAHRLPERVLHRDIRPHNIMLQGFYAIHDDVNVLVLDFDLSWHKDSFEVSVKHDTGSGYLAPEQVLPTPKVSTRNALVDSFGLGMTFYFTSTGVDPVFAQHRHSNWFSNVVQLCRKSQCRSWKSLPTRFARLILACTKDDQNERWDTAQILNELERLQSAMKTGNTESAELLTEEVIALALPESAYQVNKDTLEIGFTLPGGLQLRARGDEVTRTSSVAFEWQQRGTEERKKLSKWLPDAASKVVTRLKHGGWTAKSSITSGRLAIQSELAVGCSTDGIQKAAIALREAADAVSFY